MAKDAADDAPHQKLPGIEALPRYEVLRVLGRGAMGEVLAVHDTASGQHYALKRVPPQVSLRPGQMQAIRSNFALVSGLTHQHIAVTRFLETDRSSGEIYILMDLVHGRDLASWIRDQRDLHNDPEAPLPARLVLGICEQIASALDYAHAQPAHVSRDGQVSRYGILHRDLKPENVMVETNRQYRPGVPYVKLVDFGLAAEIQASQQSLTQGSDGLNGIMGTPLYMAPEQWLGRRLTRAIDQWALAVMMYEMLAGQTPFGGVPLLQLRLQIIDPQPEQPAALTTAQWLALKRSLHVDRTQRYPSCMALVKAVAQADPQTAGIVQASETILPDDPDWMRASPDSGALATPNLVAAPNLAESAGSARGSKVAPLASPQVVGTLQPGVEQSSVELRSGHETDGSERAVQTQQGIAARSAAPFAEQLGSAPLAPPPRNRSLLIPVILLLFLGGTSLLCVGGAGAAAYTLGWLNSSREPNSKATAETTTVMSDTPSYNTPIPFETTPEAIPISTPDPTPPTMPEPTPVMAAPGPPAETVVPALDPAFAPAPSPRIESTGLQPVIPSEPVAPVPKPTLAKPETMTNAFGMQLVWIKPGEFVMGSPALETERLANETQHKVKVANGYWMGVHEVTQGEYQQVMRANPSYFSPTGAGAAAVAKLDHNRLPVENVTWHQANEFCKRLNEQEHAAGRLDDSDFYRLPTEAEWEFACRAGAETPFSFGYGLNGEAANCDGSKPYGHLKPYGAIAAEDQLKPGPNLERTTRVGSYPANPWGLFDMHGNVNEWCLDASPLNSLELGFRPSGDTSFAGYTFRGGGYSSSADGCRAAFRPRLSPQGAGKMLGFRVVMGRSRFLSGGGPPIELGAHPPGDSMYNDLRMMFGWAPPGEFKMGSPAAEPGHQPDEQQRTVKFAAGFWMGMYEVKQSEYLAVTLTNPSHFSYPAGSADAMEYPVDSVSWDDAVSFCVQLTDRERNAGTLPTGWFYRLPKEAEWEYACRAGTQTAFSFGNQLTREQANFGFFDPFEIEKREPGWGKPAGSQKYPGNDWVLRNMHGNLAEWCCDYGPLLSDAAPINPEPTVGRWSHILRGGGFDSKTVLCRSAARAWQLPEVRLKTHGFRVILTDVP